MTYSISNKLTYFVHFCKGAEFSVFIIVKLLSEVGFWGFGEIGRAHV